MLKCCQYFKGCDEDGPEPYLFRELPVGERQQGASIRPITSEPEYRVSLPDTPGCPRYRDRACWSLKVTDICP